MYACEFALIYPTPEEYIRRVDRLLAFLAKYAHQSLRELEQQPRVQLTRWAREIEWFMDEERKQVER